MKPSFEFGQTTSRNFHKVCLECSKNRSERKQLKHCMRCKNDLSIDLFDKDSKRKPYEVCRDCQHPPCAFCGSKLQEIWAPPPKEKNPVPKCNACKQCKRCQRYFPLASFGTKSSGHRHSTCKKCQYPPCVDCGKLLSTIWNPPPNTKLEPKCSRCAKKKKKDRRD